MSTPVKVFDYNTLLNDEIESLEMVEVRQKMIERDADEISKLWKLLPMTLYFFCALSSYIASILFYILWVSLMTTSLSMTN